MPVLDLWVACWHAGRAGLARRLHGSRRVQVGLHELPARPCGAAGACRGWPPGGRVAAPTRAVRLDGNACFEMGL
eukprot:13426725-Alexandrium_andersonii.AAC.1